MGGNPSFMALLKFKKHIAEAYGIPNGIPPMKVASKIMRKIKESHPNISVEEALKYAMKEFDRNKNKYEADLGRNEIQSSNKQNNIQHKLKQTVEDRLFISQCTAENAYYNMVKSEEIFEKSIEHMKDIEQMNEYINRASPSFKYHNIIIVILIVIILAMVSY